MHDHPISTVLLQVRGWSIDIRLENSLLHAAAIYEHIFLSGMAMVVTKHLCKQKGMFYKTSTVLRTRIHQILQITLKHCLIDHSTVNTHQTIRPHFILTHTRVWTHNLMAKAIEQLSYYYYWIILSLWMCEAVIPGGLFVYVSDTAAGF